MPASIKHGARWLERFLLTLWIGSMWTVGFIVAPVLFNALDDRMLAGNIAGRLFTTISYIGISSAIVLIVLYMREHKRQLWASWSFRFVVMMLLVTLIGEFGITPMMQDIKASVGTALVKGTEAHNRFSILHGISSSLFLLNSVLGLLVIIFSNASKDNS